jgi:hypothetical protein
VSNTTLNTRAASVTSMTPDHTRTARFYDLCINLIFIN